MSLTLGIKLMSFRFFCRLTLDTAPRTSANRAVKLQSGRGKNG